MHFYMYLILYSSYVDNYQIICKALFYHFFIRLFFHLPHLKVQ